MNMQIVRFGDLYAIPSGNGLSRPTAVRGEGYRMIGMGELFANDIINDIEMDRVQMSDREKQSFFVEPDDLLFARQSLVAAGAGKCSIVKELKEPTTYESHLIRVRLDKNKCNPWYYYYLFKLPDNPIKAIVNQCAQAGIRGNELVKIKVPLPPRPCQDRIVSVLSTYDNLIEVNNKRIKVLEQMAENLYKEWFVRFRFPGHETIKIENYVPKGWEYSTIEALSDILQRGISPDYDDEGSLTVISQKCIRQSIMDIREARNQTKTFRKELNLRDGDTVICSTGTGTLGRVGQVYGEYPNTTFDSHVTLVRAKPEIEKHYLFWTLKEMQPWLTNMGIGSTNQQELYRNTIKNAKALNPDRTLLNRFEAIIEPIHQSINMLINSQENLIKQRDLLLPRLMSGKLEV